MSSSNTGSLPQHLARLPTVRPALRTDSHAILGYYPCPTAKRTGPERGGDWPGHKGTHLARPEPGRSISGVRESWSRSARSLAWVTPLSQDLSLSRQLQPHFLGQCWAGSLAYLGSGTSRSLSPLSLITELLLTASVPGSWCHINGASA